MKTMARGFEAASASDILTGRGLSARFRDAVLSDPAAGFVFLGLRLSKAGNSGEETSLPRFYQANLK